MQEHALTVARTARVVTLGPLEGAPRSVWVALHGYGQLATRFARRFAALDDGSRLIVVPEGLSRYYTDHDRGLVGATWMTRENRLQDIEDYVRYLDQVVAWLPLDAARVSRTVIGFSQGSATAWRWVTQGGSAPPARLVIWGGEVPPDLDVDRAARRLAHSEIVFVSGATDPYCPPDVAARYQRQLADAGLASRVVTFPGGHDLDGATLVDVAG